MQVDMTDAATGRRSRGLGDLRLGIALAKLVRQWAPVAQWTEQRFPKPRVGGSIPSGRTS